MQQFLRILIFTIVIIGCTSQTAYNDDSAIPKAFQENNSGILEMDYKRGSSNLMEELWAEYLKENDDVAKELERLDDKKREVQKHRQSFDAFINKNNDYYRSAINLNSTISDSLLKEKIKVNLRNSEDNYLKKIKEYETYKASISNLYSKINNYVTAFKIEETLKMTEEYQKNTKFLLEELGGDIKKLEEIRDYFKESL